MERVICLLRDYQNAPEGECKEQLKKEYQREVIGWNRDYLLWMNDAWFQIPDGCTGWLV